MHCADTYVIYPALAKNSIRSAYVLDRYSPACVECRSVCFVLVRAECVLFSTQFFINKTVWA